MAREPDPPTQLRELAARLAGASELPRAVLVRGNETWFRMRAVDLVTARAKELGHELCRHDANSPEFSPQNLLGDLCSRGLFAPARTVVLEAPEKVAKKDTLLLKGLTGFLTKSDAAGALVLVADALRADSVLAKAVAAAGGVAVNCRRLWDSPPPWDAAQDPRKSELAQWLVARARERRIALDANGALVLVAASGNDLAALDAQLDRLAAGGGTKLVDLVSSDAAGSPFKVADELARGDAASAIFGLETLYQNGIREDDGTKKLDRTALFAMLAPALKRSLRQALVGALALEAKKTPAEAAELAGVPHQEAAQRAFHAALAARPARAQRAMLEDVARLEREQRSGGEVDENDLVLFALRWRAKARAR
jgi:DNA polymerase III delta subunit